MDRVGELAARALSGGKRRTPHFRIRSVRTGLIAAGVLGALLFLLAGAIGAYRYVWTFALYRGEPPPSVPESVAIPGAKHGRVKVVPAQVLHIEVKSSALGRRRIPVLVVLPPGYNARPARRYPSIYLLEGYPAFGGPGAFVNVGNIAGVESVLVAEKKMAPAVLVMPSGAPSLLVDTEWANGVQRHSAWETFVAKDLVKAVDARFRVLNSGASRALGGLSEGGYGALNIGMHHPGEYRVLESWSGYTVADDLPAVFGGRSRGAARRVLNSPALELPAAAARLRAAGTYFWFYTGDQDYDVAANRAFAGDLASLRIAHQFQVFPGDHNWGLWRAHLAQALQAASSHLRHD